MSEITSETQITTSTPATLPPSKAPAAAPAAASPSTSSPSPAAPAAPRDHLTRRLTRNLLCRLADEEVAQKTMEFLGLERDIEGVKRDAKERIDPMQTRIDSLKAEVRGGRYVDVTCFEVRDFQANEYTLTRLDTNEQIEHRALTAAERQGDLFAAPSTEQDLPRSLQAVGLHAEVHPEVQHGPRLDRYLLTLPSAKELKAFQSGLGRLAFELGVPANSITCRQGSKPRSLELDLPRPAETWAHFGLTDLLGWLSEAQGALPLCPGVDVLGRPVWLDLAKAPHLLVAGATGSGKSVTLHAMICSLLLTRSPADVQLILLDPKRVELRLYAESVAHEVEIVSSNEDMRRTLDGVVRLMEQRYVELEQLGVRDIDGAQAAGSTMRRIVVVVEELADLVIQAGVAEDALVRLAQKSRAAGIHLLLATQRPDAETFSGLLRSNVDARIALAVQKNSESRIILDQEGAETLLKPGDMLIRYGGEIKRCHGLYLKQEEIARVVRGEAGTTGQAAQPAQEPAPVASPPVAPPPTSQPAETAATPLDLPCPTCGAEAGLSCLVLRGKGKGQPLKAGTYHDARIAAMAAGDPEPVSERWGDGDELTEATGSDGDEAT